MYSPKHSSIFNKCLKITHLYEFLLSNLGFFHEKNDYTEGLKLCCIRPRGLQATEEGPGLWTCREGKGPRATDTEEPHPTLRWGGSFCCRLKKAASSRGAKGKRLSAGRSTIRPWTATHIAGTPGFEGARCPPRTARIQPPSSAYEGLAPAEKSTVSQRSAQTHTPATGSTERSCPLAS